jgi:tetratricopeptide (TPR) repeat protein
LAAAQGAQAGVQAVRIQLDGLGGQVQDDLAGLRMGLGAQLDALPQAIAAVILRVLGPGNLGIRVTPVDEFTHHDGAARGLILEAQAELARLTPGPGYTVAALVVGSALSSTGAGAGAEALFVRAAESAETVPERALAAYNLFQARLRQGPTRYPEALTALRQAVDLEPDRYATHEEWKYPTQAILGAGGMGCAFLCREPVEGNRPVVVKTFWRAVPGAVPGPVQATFAEAMTMNRVGGGHVPALRGYGFAPGGRRPYIVMDYLDGYQDGEAWLAEHGPLPLAQGLALGRRVLEAMAAAHAAGVVHLALKPANLLLKAAGEGIEVKVIDFGLAQVAERVDGARAAGASRHGLSVLASSIAGTWDYSPPEQMARPSTGRRVPGAISMPSGPPGIGS